VMRVASLLDACCFLATGAAGASGDADCDSTAASMPLEGHSSTTISAISNLATRYTGSVCSSCDSN
jgi:hypothetical protein